MPRNFLWVAAFLPKPGGTLVYSTRTINPKENEQMVHYTTTRSSLLLKVNATSETTDYRVKASAKMKRFSRTELDTTLTLYTCA
ncbi:hypothetical protein V7S43_008300 [Phytophthora oleae]|uniref:SAM-dependent MTase RsmB/NOP-type domain-containing protein n=1 Tax=Phytophthora oleae TaxID=2107226 RepID=A0ABD3FLS3_9STRA